jgi:hypothetical protein
VAKLMFEHVTILLSFVFAIALTHLLSSTTELVWARDRVRFSELQALWMFNAALQLLINWLGFWYTNTIPNWNAVDVSINFTAALIQYFTCSLISMRPKDEGVIDMPAFYARQRAAIFMAFAATDLVNMFQNWWFRNAPGQAADLWFWADMMNAPMLMAAIIAGWAHAKWLQWLAAVATTGMFAYFLITYAI